MHTLIIHTQLSIHFDNASGTTSDASYSTTPLIAHRTNISRPSSEATTTMTFSAPREGANERDRELGSQLGGQGSQEKPGESEKSRQPEESEEPRQARQCRQPGQAGRERRGGAEEPAGVIVYYVLLYYVITYYIVLHCIISYDISYNISCYHIYYS